MPGLAAAQKNNWQDAEKETTRTRTREFLTARDTDTLELCSQVSLAVIQLYSCRLIAIFI